MPIRFRCAYCNQLMGISRRKSGTVVSCPTCAGQVVVPNAPADEKEGEGDPVRPLVFEHDNFDELLNQNESKPVALPKQKSGRAPAPVAAPSVHVDEATESGFGVPKGRSGQVSSRAKKQRTITLDRKLKVQLSIAAAVALALAFGLGVCAGRWFAPAAEAGTASMIKQGD
jgi:hypothetical protein